MNMVGVGCEGRVGQKDNSESDSWPELDILAWVSIDSCSSEGAVDCLGEDLFDAFGILGTRLYLLFLGLWGRYLRSIPVESLSIPLLIVRYNCYLIIVSGTLVVSPSRFQDMLQVGGALL